VVCTKCGTRNENRAEVCRRCATGLHPASMKGKLACYTHANREAINSCGVCGNALCSACTIEYNSLIYCDSCAPPQATRQAFDADYERIPVIDPARSQPATFGQRLMAFLIDAMIFIIVGGMIGLIGFWFTGRFLITSPNAGRWFWIIWGALAVSMTVYTAVMTSMSGQTFGKQITQIIVLKPDGHILDWQTSSLRTFMAIFSALPLGLGFLWMLWDPKGRTWHDNIADTMAFQYEEVI